MHRDFLSSIKQRFDYSSAAFCVSGLTIAWLPAPLPFDAYKHHTVGTVMAMLAVCLAIAGLRQNPKWHARSLLALGLGVLCFLAYLLIVPL